MAFACDGEEEILPIARLCAQIILENGGETYRAEETVIRVCKAYGFEETGVVAMPTGVFITVSKNGARSGTSIQRISRRGLDLTAVDEVNTISRRLTAGDMAPAAAGEALKAIRRRKPLPKWLLIVAAGLSSGFFSLLFRGSLFDFCAATACGMLVQGVSCLIHASDMLPFASSLIGGLLIGVCSLLFTRLTGMGNLQTIITGAMMPLLPGIPMTNAIRDTMRGDLVSGVARAAEALMIATAIAFGIGVVLALYFAVFK